MRLTDGRYLIDFYFENVPVETPSSPSLNNKLTTPMYVWIWPKNVDSYFC